MTKEEIRSRKEQYSLEELNQQFISKINKKKKRKRVPGVWMLILLVLVILIVVLILRKVTDTQPSEEIIKDNESILSEEEQEKWASTDIDGEKIYVVLNTKIHLDGNNAYIRLINPIYSTYYYNITIYPEGEEDTIFYQSERVAPGTILEAVKLSAEPTKEQYRVVVKYQIYDDKGNELGVHPVSVEFTADEIKEE